MNDEEREFRRQQIELLNLIVSKLVLIESGQSTMERGIFCGVTKTTNKMLQKMRTEIIREIRSERNAKERHKVSVWHRLRARAQFICEMIKARYER